MTEPVLRKSDTGKHCGLSANFSLQKKSKNPPIQINNTAMITSDKYLSLSRLIHISLLIMVRNTPELITAAPGMKE
jgi:hypothetical protein